ncbi:hypothetical protein TCAL_08363 [Tigriopus californicus]|uniref:Uncharacterized protein n=1 Tax=Tigriopus californicus TaxID=6832 RepID=A0A553PHD9_TIGCA|nr:hypothetical protein TCAL_08363 [Tigriopus californicus]
MYSGEQIGSLEPRPLAALGHSQLRGAPRQKIRAKVQVPVHGTDHNGALKHSRYTTSNGIEKESFLDGRGGIQLTPSWEERNVPEDQLNFRNFSQSMDRLDLEMNPPIDRV